MANKQIEVMTEYNLEELKLVKVALHKDDEDEDLEYDSDEEQEIARDITEPRDLQVIAALRGGSLTGVLLENEGVVANAKLDEIEELRPVKRKPKVIKRKYESCPSKEQVNPSSSSRNTPDQGSKESKEISFGTDTTEIVIDGVPYVERYPNRRTGSDAPIYNQTRQQKE